MLLVHGPGGVGKTSLLGQFSRLAEQAGATVASLDAQLLNRRPSTFQASLALALGADPAAPSVEALARHADRSVVLVDTYELLAPLDDWLREVFLPQLPEHVLTVLASRQPPAGLAG